MVSKYYCPKVLQLILVSLAFLTCKAPNTSKEVLIKNPLGVSREEVVGIDLKSIIEESKIDSNLFLSVKDKTNDELLITQLVDNDLDGFYDEILFQVKIGPKEQKLYEITRLYDPLELKPGLTTYSRFVPERTDDYTWENDKVAFRTYGPEAQRLVEENEPGGTLSSGIDLWLKRVDYSIIDKWYAENNQKPGYYHIDHGEGYDPYHVGKSRGTGGIGVWQDDSLVVSRNFISYKTIATGPLRTIFELYYAPWSEYSIIEAKRISLDLGSNFSKFEISLEPKNPVPNYAIGITLHEGNGTVDSSVAQGIYYHWEKIDTSYIGEGIIIDPDLVLEAKKVISNTPDQSQLLVITTSEQQILKYYAGFAWTRSCQVKNKTEWMNILTRQSVILKNPLEICVR